MVSNTNSINPALLAGLDSWIEDFVANNRRVDENPHRL
jgi:hypothetical protein